MTEDFYSPGEAAKLLGISMRTLARLVETGALPVWQVAPGRLRQFPKAVIDRKVEERKAISNET